MSTAAARKKSMVEMPVAHNTLLNKAASQSTSLYQQSSALRAQLLRIHRFHLFFQLSEDSPRQSTDPVTQLWDCFALGVSLCYLYNLLPHPQHRPIELDVDPESDNVRNLVDRDRKRAIALFNIAVKSLNHGDGLQVRDIWERENTDGFVKVVDLVNHIVSLLPADVFVEPSVLSPATPPSDPSAVATSSAIPASGKEAARNNIIRELVETERKYVQDLEVMQKYAQALAQSNTVTQDTLHLLFPNLNQLLNFQRKFLIRVEGTAEMPWHDQRWGSLFSNNEEDFTVYEPYCANYVNATNLMLLEGEKLMKYNHLINVKSELPAFLIKPVQRICKYPLLLDSLIKASSPQEYPHFDELKEGSAAAKRITDKINEAQRRAENSLTVENLSARVDDWKGHHVSHFGDLLLDDIFTVTKSEVDREYHVFLFERIILCCKEDLGIGKDKRSKSNSILKKPQTPILPQTPNPSGNTKKTTPLILKGRIYLNNVTDAKSNVAAGSYSLNIWWKGDDDLEYFTLRCRNEEQVRQWETSVKKLIERLAARRASERSTSRLAGALASQTPRTSVSMPDRERSNSVVPSMPPHPYAAAQAAPQRNTYQHPYMAAGAPDEPQMTVNTNVMPNYGHSGYPHRDGFEPDDDYEDYPSPLVGSGRATPMDYASSRRGTAPNLEMLGYAPPQEQRAPRAQTEDASGSTYRQWQAQYPGHQPPHHGHPAAMVPGLPNGPRMTAGSRMNSAQSFTSDSSFGAGVRHSTSRPQLRQQISQSRLRQAGAEQERAAAPSPVPASYQPHHQSMPSRSRSASQPSAYLPKHTSQAPPLPQTDWNRMGIERVASSTGTKRSSGSSHSTGTGDESYSPGGSSPITPFGSSESSLSQGPGPRGSYEHHATARGPIMGRDNMPVKVKVHFGTDIFVVQVPRNTEYAELVEKVGKKIRLCGPRRDDGPLRVKYEDEEGDLVSMRSSEDVEMAFAARAQVVLHVQ
ncbi:hypothetical protein PENSPDRAFT_670249 [Peniophora sp. CONT]|nr:hypothetical protein PENSPDRAFT_670249 [Peniophora sp. CONT]